MLSLCHLLKALMLYQSVIAEIESIISSGQEAAYNASSEAILKGGVLRSADRFYGIQRNEV